MNIEDQGYITKIRKHQENGLMLTIFSQNHGLLCGYIRKGKTPMIAGQLCHFTKKARLEEHLGMLTLEIVSSPLAQFYDNRDKLIIFNSCLELINTFLKESDPHEALFNDFKLLLVDFNSSDRLYLVAKYVDFEFKLLSNLGFGLDLERCAVSNKTTDLHYISPKTGAVVCKEVGEPYHNKLIELPQFLKGFTTDRKHLLEAFKVLDFIINSQLLPYVGNRTLHHRGLVKQVLSE